ncbi:hypothetical protein [Plantibacter sp. ME-Dv--P-095]|uniref:hypothetical protein n=1 Tax=Plantibacter sp. ME-Dv--P-095 TaxID=3040299 RepID=UPI00254CC375|nr:hypothetical protein [Plantibacter sp. ME-Dv--P-095]
MVKANDPEYRTPRLVLGWTWAALGIGQLALRVSPDADSHGSLSWVILGVLQVVLGAVIVIQAWRLPKPPPAEAARTDDGGAG